MAKGSFNGLLTGKLGNTVFYRVTNSNNKEKQGQRQYNATMTNPRTRSQADQRMRMKPAINFYRGLSDLLDHSWEGVKYGALSRQKFMQLALSGEFEGFPYVPKGTAAFVPGEYPVSLGSVGVNTGVERLGGPTSDEWSTATMEGLYGFTPNGAYHENTWGELSQRLVDLNVGLRDGDELTYICVYEKNGFFLPRHSYVVLDVNSTLTAKAVFEGAGFCIGEDGWFAFIEPNSYQEEDGTFDLISDPIVAAAFIVSRHPSRTSSVWLRSSSVMAVSEDFKNRYMSADAFTATRASYMDRTTDLTSDWLLNQADNNTRGNNGSGSLRPNFTLENRQVVPYGGGDAVTLVYYNDGSQEGFLCNDSMIVEGAGDAANAFIDANALYSLDGTNLRPAGNKRLVVGSRTLPLNTFPSIKAKIAQFYTFVS